jgi:hypothetical protein
MSTDDGNGLSRWSRLKRKRAQGEAVEEPPVRGAAAPVVAPAPTDNLPVPGDADDADGEERELTEEEAAYVETLPPVEELTGESDFTAFMDKRVPEFLRRRALRKLWLSDPAFSFLDGMNEYDEDYSMMVELAAEATSYRPDQGGYAWRDKPKEEAAEETDAPPNSDEGAVSAKSDGAVAAEAGDGPDPDAGSESIADKAARVQGRGGADVRARTYTANPYYQAPGLRDPAPERLSGAGDADDDDLGDAEDEFS